MLHVDGDPEFSEAVGRFLEREDDRFDVTTAPDVSEGLASLAERDVDCIVSDYDMPGRDGLEFLEAVRSDDPDLPFILYTGKGSEAVASDAISAGVTDYLQKERGTDQYAILANRIANAVEARRYQRLFTERTRRLETLIDNLPGMVYRCRNVPDWPMETVEGEVESLSGYTARELERNEVKWGESVVHPADQAETWETIQDSLSADGTFEVTYRIVTADRTTKWVWERGRGIDEADGDPETLEGFITDVTEQKRRERELRRAREEYGALINGMNDTAWVLDIDGTILAVNDAAVETMGYSREELRSMRPHDFDIGLDEAELSELIETMPTDGIQVFETVHETKDGERIPVEISSSLIPYHGDTVVLSIARDISDRKEREEQLERFASIVSHDLRNPLNVAQGHLESAREERDSEHLEHVARAHERMAALVDDLLALSRAGARIGDVESVDLGATVDHCWQNVATANATVRTDIDRTVRADPTRLAQLLENLFRNAVEHGGDEVSITVGERPDGFYVADDGRGIAEQEREEVFRDGYSTAAEGTGFGLSIVEQVADAHGWSVTVSDSEHGGARFDVVGLESADD
ncbi:HTR-like protein [Natrinema versiforme JCM 10478]|uniref:histidine kinase n=1 Tax=Natrinema versiforme JCM 10478 TaxID=1227496 RepID=L9XUX5_9EURY|nr:HTR-like protein [Natrinema versiforme JCM 10478]